MGNDPHTNLPRQGRMLWQRRCAALLALCAVLALITAPAVARAEVFTATHTHVMGDDESRNDAREACRQEARREIIERIGTYTESLSATKDFQLTQDEVRSFAGAMLTEQKVDERWSVNGTVVSLTCAMTAEADLDKARTLMVEQGKQVIARERFREWRGEVRGNATRKGGLQGPGMAESGNDAMTETMVRDEAAALAAERQRMTRLADQVAVKGMTLYEADRLLGKPAAIVGGRNALCAQYGRVWYVFEGGRLTCARTRLSAGANGQQCDCAGFGMDFILR